MSRRGHGVWPAASLGQHFLQTGRILYLFVGGSFLPGLRDEGSDFALLGPGLGLRFLVSELCSFLGDVGKGLVHESR